MSLPFVSRTAFDAVVSERDRLREQIDSLLDHRQRVERRELHMPEIAPKAAEREMTTMPPEVQAVLSGFDSEQLRAHYTDSARRMYRRGMEWPQIAVLIKRSVGEGEE